MIGVGWEKHELKQLHDLWAAGATDAEIAAALDRSVKSVQERRTMYGWRRERRSGKPDLSSER